MYIYIPSREYGSNTFLSCGVKGLVEGRHVANFPLRHYYQSQREIQIPFPFSTESNIL
jgi:hypothetical protein